MVAAPARRRGLTAAWTRTTLAGQSVALLVGLVVLSLLVLAPGQPRAVLGVEVAVLGVLLIAGVTATTVRVLPDLERRRWRVSRVVGGLIGSVPIAVGGISLATAASGGVHWLLGSAVLLFTISSCNAWVLLIEIRR